MQENIVVQDLNEALSGVEKRDHSILRVFESNEIKYAVCACGKAHVMIPDERGYHLNTTIGVPLCYKHTSMGI